MLPSRIAVMRPKMQCEIYIQNRRYTKTQGGEHRYSGETGEASRGRAVGGTDQTSGLATLGHSGESSLITVAGGVLGTPLQEPDEEGC